MHVEGRNNSFLIDFPSCGVSSRATDMPRCQSSKQHTTYLLKAQEGKSFSKTVTEQYITPTIIVLYFGTVLLQVIIKQVTGHAAYYSVLQAGCVTFKRWAGTHASVA